LPNSDQVIPAPRELLDEKEAADYLTVAVATMRNWRSLKRGPRFLKIGARCVRYSRADLDSFMKVDPAFSGVDAE